MSKRTIEEVRKRLTWHKHEEDKEITISGFGLIVKDNENQIWEIGSYVWDKESEWASNVGCGCCSDAIQVVEYAFLSELLDEPETK